MSVTAADVKALRDRTGAAMMDCKAALTESEGDADRALEILRVKGQASAAKREGRGTNEGVVSSYIHANDKVGAMVEVQCETDFVARNEDFRAFAYEVALHIAATAPQYVTIEEIPAAEREAERRVFEEKAREEGKPDNVVEKIVEGQLVKWARKSPCSTSLTSTPRSTTRSRSRSCARRWRRRPARTSASPVSLTS